MAQTHYTNAQIWLHWATVILIAAMAYTGLDYYYEWTDESVIYWHQIVGQALIVVLLLRITMRLRYGGRIAPTHAAWERVLASAVHFGLYLAMIVFVVTGYVAASALTNNALLFPVNIGFARGDIGEELLETHYAMKWVLLALFALHLAGAFKHAFIDKDDTLPSILPSNSKELT